jgi:hypothetical protein
MHIETSDKDLSVILDLYNNEIDTLKSKLLNGVPWEELVMLRRNITELAIAIHKSHKDKTGQDSILNETLMQATQ